MTGCSTPLRAIVPGEEGWGPEDAAVEARSLIDVDAKSPIHHLGSKVERAGLFAYSLALGDASSDGSYAEVDNVGVAVVNGEIDPGRRRPVTGPVLGEAGVSGSARAGDGVGT